MQRRTLLPVLGCLCLGAVGLAGPVRAAWAQRATNPIAGSPGQRLGAAVVGGRFNPGSAAGPAPGVFVVESVDADDSTIRLRDEGGQSGTVHVDDDIFDVEDLKPGDFVEVDFLVPHAGSAALEAGGLWKVQR